jgi:hypothetical protein
MSGGWISGIAYPLMIAFSVVLGFKAILIRAPWRRAFLAIFATFLGTVGESFIIDTDHWRHFFLILGLVWGTSVASREWKADADRHVRERARPSRQAFGEMSGNAREADLVSASTRP